jgi:hypothetical protein
VESSGQHTIQGVTAEAGTDRVPRSVAFWQVTPASLTGASLPDRSKITRVRVLGESGGAT